ncbi:HNH endonuclease, partial [Mycobacterium sp. ITM-2017-0098]
MRQCLGCGAPLLKRSQKIYCSNACQALARRNT